MKMLFMNFKELCTKKRFEWTVITEWVKILSLTVHIIPTVEGGFFWPCTCKICGIRNKSLSLLCQEIWGSFGRDKSWWKWLTSWSS